MRPILTAVLVVTACCCFLFRHSFDPALALFANDGPLGLMMSDVYTKTNVFDRVWNNLNFFGSDAGAFMPSVTSVVFWVLGPLKNNQWYPAISLVFLAMSVAALCRQLGLRPVACVVAGVSAGLNSNFLSYACWGLYTLPMCVGWAALAMAAVASPWRRWVAYTVAGGCVTQSIMEGYDNGAILSLYVAAFAFIHETGNRRWISVPWIACVAAVAGAFALQSLIQSNVSGVAQVSEQDASRKWEWATQWSFPPEESARIVIPGLYGYRMDTPGAPYLGRVGSDASWDKFFSGQGQPSDKMLRFSGAGPYAGVGVVLLALVAVGLSARRSAFWAAAAGVSLLLAFGRFTWCYELFYNLPYASAIRIPAKFLHPMSLCLCVLAGIGVESLWSIDKPWKIKVGVVGVLGLFGLLAGFSFATPSSIFKQLQSGVVDMPTYRVATENIHMEYMAFIVVTMAFLLLIARILSGGINSRLAAWLLVALVAMDLGRAASPWVVYYNHRARLQSAPLFLFLAEQTPAGRVCGTVPWRMSGDWGNAQQHLENVYRGEWMEHQFRRWNILTREYVQMPRMPEDLAAWQQAVAPDPIRDWTESGVRWLLTVAPMADELNKIDPEHRFKMKFRFSLDGARPMLDDNGAFALVEFLGGGRFDPDGKWQIEASPNVIKAKNITRNGISPLYIRDRLTADWHAYGEGGELKIEQAFNQPTVWVQSNGSDVVLKFEPPRVLWWWSTLCIFGIATLAGYNLWKTR